ncbi:beta-ketoacyl-ACP synthase III [Campylobacter ureolyticus]|uniref:Beta-ketoacyl-[acyl-carrier-protein] synthase III n=1 Tax=Campylobacter ureolyticus TaxID=827 RepID=A0A9Q4KH78_9BACT|nr:beta-ketoacyl-ACP synthase III [Campylobacter ureolyticus]MCZ6159603.1 ketoacyl-ACP synthase III [Campylobacter ureolyticus]MCZ6163492.1 ketoacyl-ACP synthase III [Campylobacter ureolyticus]MCZ6165426.1 ketoacyl-ACP synthase III [Campylobacter ureolyticus]MCZ6166899.1 ketoacyl-ACP synthase III [Campylobacter ureolyticus]MCZ6185888.1 ketoacyl-ACP synthase III [Campylobacter ureolyticus]
MKKASMISIAAYAPEHILTNQDLEKMVETSDDWITKRTGIKTRHIAKDEVTSDLGYKAAKLAIKRANLTIDDIDCIICATISPDYLCMPSTACRIADLLGIDDVMAFDISAACSGFIYLIEIAKSMVESGLKKNVLIIGAEKLSSIVNWNDRTTCVLFGDGAGAAIISESKDENYIIDTHTSSDGSKCDLLITPGCGSKNPASNFVVENNLQFIHMKGNEVFKTAINTLTNDVLKILEKNKISSEKINLFVPHQANLRIINAVKDRLNLSDNQCVVTVDKFGNTSSASIPMALNYAYENNNLKNGDLLLLDAFGGGFTWGSALIKFGGK